ncbi:MAG TPA: hypothetical protein VIR29_06475 [Anseongella sp.]
MSSLVKKSVAIVLLAVLCFQCLGSLGVLAWYQANRSYIASVLCINRDKPEMHCDGQCVLAKKLRKMEGAEPSSVPQVQAKVEIPVFLLSRLALNFSLPGKVLKRYPVPYANHYQFSWIISPFHPPPAHRPMLG